MKARIAILAAACTVLALAAAPAAQAQFGLTDIGVHSEAQGGGEDLRAGSHPFALTTELSVTTEEKGGKVVPVEELKDLDVSFPPGLVGIPSAVPQCPTPLFLAGKNGECSNDSAVGVAEVEFGEPGKTNLIPIYNLEPSPATVSKVGFIVEDRAPVAVEISLNPNSPNNVIASSTAISQAIFVFRTKITIWGVPAAAAHDAERGSCLLEGGSCDFEGGEEVAFLTLPASCEAPLSFGFKADSWQSPGDYVDYQAAPGEPGPPLAPSDCDDLDFDPEIDAEPTSTAASSATGLDFQIGFDDPGISDPDLRSQATIAKAEVTLPEGMTLNPGAGEGLGSCSQAQFEAESLASGPTCPAASKVGSVEVTTPLLEDRVQRGSVYVATPYDNPFDSLFALYIVIREPELGVLIKLAGEVSPDPLTGQLTTTFGEAAYPLPQVPISEFRFEFRSGPRAPLTTPTACGPHTATATFTPSSGKAPVTRTATFSVSSGPGGAPCLSDPLPFASALGAGSGISTAGAFSPFYLHIFKGYGQQDIVDLSAILPAGLTGKIAGIPPCAQAAVDAARLRPGAEETAAPSCPAASRLGSIASGSGAGSALTYVGGTLYLGGPQGTAPYSLVAIVPALAGPFDLGTVVVQQGLDINPYTADVEVRGTPGSVPRILAGVPLALRDLRVAVDRAGFVLNPTDCEPLGVRVALLGSQGSLDQLGDRYQASDCAALAFKPKLRLRLKGGTKRSKHPAARVTIAPRSGDANLERISVLLPHSQFIDQDHINNPCTRARFNAGTCPKGSVLGRARAFTPLLDQPLEGPVYFRSNGGARELPDIVADVRGQGFRIVQVGFVDSVRARIRVRFQSFPDAPVTKIVTNFKGGKEGLLQNSEDLCARPQSARVKLRGQNGRLRQENVKIETSCRTKKPGKGSKRRVR